MAKHLTPDRRAAIVARYQECANALQVAREFEVGETTVRRVLAQAQSAKKSDLHARAVARAIRDARRSLARKTLTIDAYLASTAGEEGVPAIEPRDLAALVNASAGVLSKLLEADSRIEQKKLSRLTRDLRRAEIELARLKIAAGGTERHEHTVVGLADGAALAREIFGSPSALERHDERSGEASTDPVEGDVLPVPDPLAD